MTTTTVVYPVTPEHVDDSIIQPSTAFKKEVFNVAGAIVFFMVVYLVLIVAAGALAFACGYGGLMLVLFLPKFFTLMIGLGLVGLGVMVIYFLLKFVVKQNKVDRSGLLEIKEKDQPELFAFIRTLTRETQAPFPKKIYLSPEVNACVFYDSGFWSMFLPVRKNLQIGLGLVNCVNLSEFKAILAHEFGHFSQRSMKLGSYVYNVNKIIYNLLYDNDGYGKTLESWANISDYFALFAGLTVKIVVGIQWVLQGVYGIVNKSYMSLSRQMEFHADAVAAYVSGSDHLITSLRRLEVADTCYNRLFEHYHLWFREHLKADNLYEHHTEVMKHFADEHGIPVQHGLPQVNAKTFAHFNHSKIVIKDQWASHPSTDDREDHLKKLNIRTEVVNISAWSIFRNAEQLQKEMTEKVYRTVTFGQQPGILNFQVFHKKYYEEVKKYSLHKTYKGFFDSRSIAPFDFPEAEPSLAQGENRLEEILNDETVQLPYRINGLKADLNTLEMIHTGSFSLKTFELDGARYTKDDAEHLIANLQGSLSVLEKQREATDQKIMLFFSKHAYQKQVAGALKERYAISFAAARESEEDTKRYQDMAEVMAPIYNQNLSLEAVHAIMNQVKLQEPAIKDRIRKIAKDPSFESLLKAEERTKLEEYVSKDREYFTSGSFDNEALGVLNEALSIYQMASADRNFSAKKEVLEWQLSLLN